MTPLVPHVLCLSLAVQSPDLSGSKLNLECSRDVTAVAILQPRLLIHEARERLEALVHEPVALPADLRHQPSEASGQAGNCRSRAGAPVPPPSPGRESPVGGGEPAQKAIRARDRGSMVRIKGRLQTDYRSYLGHGWPASSLSIRRATLGAQGEIGDRLSYVVDMELVALNNEPLRNAYLNARFSDAFALRVGRFVAPFSQERLHSASWQSFLERSSLSLLTPGRSPGLMIHGSVLDGRGAYQLSLQNAFAPGAPAALGRVRFMPFAASNLLDRLAFGGAYVHARRGSSMSSRGRTASGRVTFFEAVPVKGAVQRANFEFEWLFANFALRGEVDRTNERRDGLAPGGGDLPGLVGLGYMLDVGYVVGGAQQSYGRVAPRRSVMRGGAGALQLVARYERLRFDTRDIRISSQAYTLGVNWWLTDAIRHQSNLAIEDLPPPTRLNRNPSVTYLGRMQFVF